MIFDDTAASKLVVNSLIYSLVTTNILETMNELGIRRYIGVTGGSLTITGDNKRFLNKIGAKMFEIFFSEMMMDKKKGRACDSSGSSHSF
jgi:hypothetical protein